MYAVIALAGKQFRIEEGDKITVDRLDAEEGEKIKITEVLLISDKKNLKIGSPVLENAAVTLTVVSNQKAKKIRVATYKAKSKYRRVKGHRQLTTTVQVDKIKA